MAELLIPPTIEEAYYPNGIARQALIEGGEINTTLLIVDNADEKSILQRLSPIYEASLAEDYDVVSAHLRAMGWEMAVARQPINGAIYLPDPDDPGRLWRSHTYIESQAGSEFEGDWEASVVLGSLLGRLHCDLSELDYQPRFNLPHFHDAQYYGNHLRTVLPEIKDPASSELADNLLAVSDECTVAEVPSQLVHGDPRIGNALFKHGKPFTFIDWDGLKIANPLLDVGDMLQSTVSELRPADMARFSATQLYPVIDAYHHERGLNVDKHTFRIETLAAGRLVALVLGIRHLIDSVEDTYFTPPNRFETRYEFNSRRANEQWRVCQALKVQA